MRHQGSSSTPVVECINKRLGKWRVRCDYVIEDNEKESVSFEESDFSHKPTIEEVQDFVVGVENGKIDLAILSGFEWNGMKVWLSSENQFNYKAAYDLAVQTNGASLPVTFKFGDSTPVYHTFETLEEISDFYTSAMSYVNKTLADGWSKKDSLDWSEYERLLTNADEIDSAQFG